ncbi:MAG: ATP-binding cassette domain-containing protein, partial [Endomicrobium sp.]|nr:ATP-binding cassette domain-containing protein [Endomicrobium sp.]
MKVDRLTKSYNKTDLNNTVRVLKNVSFEIKLTEHKIAIIGPSGAGKSTLLHILGLMERPTTGAVYIYGINCFAQDNKFLCNFRKNNIGFIFQSHYLLYDLTVIENILLPVWSNRNIKILLAKKLLNNVGLLHKQDFFPN